MSNCIRTTSVTEELAEMVEVGRLESPAEVALPTTVLLSSTFQQNGVPRARKESHHLRRPEEQPYIGKYKFIRTIGKGNFAKVKLACHVITGKEVAIKIIDKTKLSEASRQKLYREVRILKMMDHPNIVKLFEIISNERVLYLVMEYASRGEVFDFLISHGKLAEKEARIKFRQIVSAVQYCHQKRVVHRDLKAENLLLDASMNIKIADFGFSNEFSSGRKLDTFCGSPPYAAPELFEGRKYDGPEVDVWSLGVILYTLVSGSLPFDGQNLRELRERVLAGKYRVPFYMSTDCEALLRRMLHLKPERRYTLEAVMKDKWINLGFEANPLIPYIEPKSDLNDPVRMEIMINMGFSRQEIVNSLQSASFDAIAATYFLLGYSSSLNTSTPSISSALSQRKKSSPRTTIIRSATNSSADQHLVQSEVAVKPSKSDHPELQVTNGLTSINTEDLSSSNRNCVTRITSPLGGLECNVVITDANTASHSSTSRRQPNSSRLTDLIINSDSTRTPPEESIVTASGFPSSINKMSAYSNTLGHWTAIDVSAPSSDVRTSLTSRTPTTTTKSDGVPHQKSEINPNARYSKADPLSGTYQSNFNGSITNRRSFVATSKNSSIQSANGSRFSSNLATTSTIGSATGQTHNRFITGAPEKNGTTSQFGYRLPNHEIRSHVTPAPVPITSRSKGHHTLFSTSTMSAGGIHNNGTTVSGGLESVKIARELTTLSELEAVPSNAFTRRGIKDANCPPLSREQFSYISLRAARTDARPLTSVLTANSSARANLTDIDISEGGASSSNAFSRFDSVRRTVHTYDTPVSDLDAFGYGAASRNSETGQQNSASKNSSTNFIKNITHKFVSNRMPTVVTTSTVVQLAPPIPPLSGEETATPSPTEYANISSSPQNPSKNADSHISSLTINGESYRHSHLDSLTYQKNDETASLSSSAGKQMKPRSVLFTWTMKITSVKDPDIMLDEIRKALIDNNCVYEQPDTYLFVCRSNDPSNNSVVEWEMEICRLSRLSMNGVRFKRISGSSFGYQNIVTKLTSALKS